jgi:MYXO-CTERM domain-containing protein
VYTPGETITVRWNEYIDHPSYYRIAFDDDGDNGFEMRADGQTNAAADNPVAMENALGMDAEILSIVPEVNDTTQGAGTDVREAQVTLPNITCENCTLQLIQYMYNNPMQGYYQCADIALRDAVVGGDAGADPVPGTADASAAAPQGAGGSLGTAPAPGDSSGTGGASGAPTGVAAPGAGGTAVTGAAGSQSAGTGGGAAATAGDDDDGGCSLPASGSSSNRTGPFAVLALGLALLRRRS